MEAKEKNPKRVAQGKRLAAYNARKKQEEEEQEGLTTFMDEEEGKKSHTSTIIPPAIAVVVAGVGVFCYLRRSEKKEDQQPKPRPRILRRSPQLEHL